MNPAKHRRLDDADLAAVESLASDDPVRELIAEILRVVDVSHWRFARFKNHSSADQLLVPEQPEDPRKEVEQLRQEFVLQRERTTKGPKIAATLAGFQEPYVSGITLLFADKRREFGILTLLRSEDLRPFTSVEIQILALALDSSTDRLSGLAIAEATHDRVPIEKHEQSTMHVLDRDLQVVLTWDSQEGRSASITTLDARLAQRLPAVIEDSVRDLIDHWTEDPASRGVEVARPVPFLTVRTQPLRGPTGLFIGVLLGRPPGNQVFGRAALTFKLSPRELETLAMLLQGATLDDIAQTMFIATSTVQGHIKSMLDKTESKNRSELIAKVLSPHDGAGA